MTTAERIEAGKLQTELKFGPDAVREAESLVTMIGDIMDHGTEEERRVTVMALVGLTLRSMHPLMVVDALFRGLPETRAAIIHACARVGAPMEPELRAIAAELDAKQAV